MHPSRILPVILLTAVAVAGCGTPPWEQARETASPLAPETASASPTATPTPTAKPSKIRNDLAKGSIHKKLTAGGVILDMAYYSTLDLGQWTPEATKPLTVSMSADFDGGYKQNIYLSKVTVRVSASGPEGTATTLEPLTDNAPVAPGYLVKAPNSYGQVFTLPALPAEATSVSLNFTYELLAQSAPKSKKYARQTGSDTVVIALATA